MPLNAIVVGAGIGGLTAALALRRAGHEVLVLEKDVKKHEVGFALTCGANAARVLKALAADMQRTGAVRFEGAEIVEVLPGQEPRTVVKTFEKRKLGGEIMGELGWSVHRVDLWEELRSLAVGPGEGTPVRIREGAGVADYDALAGSVTLENGEVLSADVIVAADGVKSKAHVPIVGEERPAQAKRLSNVRFVLPTEKFLQIKPLADHWEAGGRTPALYHGSELGSMVLRYGCRNNTLQNFGCYALDDEMVAKVDKWRTQGNKDLAMQRLKGFDDCMLEVVRQADPDSMYLWKIAERDPLPSFHKGRMIITGDAAHPMTPMLGQGAGQAIEDGGVLGVVLEGLQNPDEVPERLRLWNELRWARATTVQQLSTTETMEYEIPEKSLALIRELNPEYVFPKKITRTDASMYTFSFECLAEAKKAVQERFGAVDKKRVDSMTIPPQYLPLVSS